MKKFVNEFKQFAIKGNVIDLAIGVMIGTAFNQIVTSLVNDILTPPIGYLMGGIKFSDYKFILKDPVINSTGEIIQEAVTVNYGNFLQALINFLIIAVTLFFMVKIVNRLRKIEEKKNELHPTAIESKEVELLTQIRDVLEKKLDK